MKHTLFIFSLAVLLAVGGCAKGEAEASGDIVAASPSMPATEAPSGGTESRALLASTAQSPAPVAPKEVPQRAVIRNGSLSVRVENVEKAEAKVIALAHEIGGYVDSSESTDLATATPMLTMKLRIPSEKFDDTLSRIEKLGLRLSKKVSSEDVTASLVDMEARLKIMRAQEEVYRRMLAKSSNTQEMMDVQDKLMNLRGSIEGLAAQHKRMSQLAALSSLELTLQQSAEGAVAATNDPSWAKEAWGSATSALGNAARVVGTGAIWLGVFSPFWVPLAWLARQSVRKQKASQAVPGFEIPGPL